MSINKVDDSIPPCSLLSIVRALVFYFRVTDGGPYFSDWNPDFTDCAGKYWTIYGMEKGTCHGIVNALDYIKDESNDLLDILFDHIVFI